MTQYMPDQDLGEFYYMQLISAALKIDICLQHAYCDFIRMVLMA